METTLFDEECFLNNNGSDLVRELINKKFTSLNILDCIKKIPRELFVDKKFSKICYKNIPLPIDCNQTISQPLVVALMLNYLNLKKTDEVLEVGTGTGYQTALIANLCKHVYTIEIFRDLLSQAKINHNKLNLKNISYMLGNGAKGWNKPICFDAIIISASTEEISSKLLKCLKIRGKLIYPKKYSTTVQKLLLLKKTTESKYATRELFEVKFVPLL